MPESYLLSMVGGVGFIVHLNLALRLRSFNHTAIAGLFAALGLMTRPAEILLLGAPSLLLTLQGPSANSLFRPLVLHWESPPFGGYLILRNSTTTLPGCCSCTPSW